MMKTKEYYVNNLNVLYEDNHLIVVEKPIDVLSQKDITNDFDMNEIIKDYLKVKYNSKLDEKDILDKEKLGDKFINYHIVNKDGVSNLIFSLDTKITKNIEIKAMYENDIETIKVSFDSNGGTQIESLTIEKGSKLVLPKSPTKEGYIFKNWKDKEGNIIKNGTVLKNDITLYAVYEKESKPTEKKPSENKPVENKPVENKPTENKNTDLDCFLYLTILTTLSLIFSRPKYNCSPNVKV